MNDYVTLDSTIDTNEQSSNGPYKEQDNGVITIGIGIDSTVFYANDLNCEIFEREMTEMTYLQVQRPSLSTALQWKLIPKVCIIILNQFSLRKLLEGDWGCSITVCVKCGSSETHISSCLEEYFVVLNLSTKIDSRWCHHTALKADVDVMDRWFLINGANVDGAYVDSPSNKQMLMSGMVLQL